MKVPENEVVVAFGWSQAIARRLAAGLLALSTVLPSHVASAAPLTPRAIATVPIAASPLHRSERLAAPTPARAGNWTPEAVASADLANLGMPGRRVATIRTLAETAASGGLPWNSPWADLREALARVPGIGPWTLGYLGIRSDARGNAIAGMVMNVLGALFGVIWMSIIGACITMNPFRGAGPPPAAPTQTMSSWKSNTNPPPAKAKW